MRNRWVLIGLVLTITAIFVMGCYTILSHPGVKGEEEQAYNGSYYREHCTDCHADYHQYPYGYYYGYYPDYYWNYPSYGHYYMYPWWFDWYYGQPSSGGPGAPSERIEKRRRGLEPPYVPGAGTYPPTTVAPGTPGTQLPPSTVEQGQQPQPQPQPREEKKTEKKDEKLPKPRR